jgi:hypothetical protein
MALMKVAMLIFTISKNGSRTGNFFDPPRTACSRMCGSPVSSGGGVGKAIARQFSESVAANTCNTLAPECRCSARIATARNSGSGTTCWI